jgi:hypothetical protein
MLKLQYYAFMRYFSLSPTALQPGVGLGLLQEFPPSLPVLGDHFPDFLKTLTF